MQQRKYFEPFATVGRKRIPSPDFPSAVSDLLDDMSYARIHGAAVCANSAFDYSFYYGNNEAVTLAAQSSRLIPIAAVPTTARLESGNERYFTDILNQGARGLLLPPPSVYRSMDDPKAVEPLANALSDRNLPLIFSGVNNLERLSACCSVAEAYPELPVLMFGTSWGCGRAFWNVMERCPNLHFELSSMHINNILEYTKHYFGMERVLYGSAWPAKSMGAIKSMIEYANLNESEKDLVAHKNACRLFGISADTLPLYDDSDCPWDTIAQEADCGIPISVKVIDMHTHIVASDAKSVSTMMPDSDSDHIIQKMDRLGIDSVLTAPWSGISYSGMMGNTEVLAAADAYPHRILGYSTINIHAPEEITAAIQMHKEHPDIFVGIKPYPPYQEFSLADDRLKPWFAYANRHHLPMLVHADNAIYAEQVDGLADQYPDITFILAHSGADFSIARINSAVAQKHGNVVLDITYTATGRGMIEFLVSQVGADKVLFGSDQPMRDPSPQLGWVCYAKLTTEEKKQILAENIERILARRI